MQFILCLMRAVLSLVVVLLLVLPGCAREEPVSSVPAPAPSPSRAEGTSALRSTSSPRIAHLPSSPDDRTKRPPASRPLPPLAERAPAASDLPIALPGPARSSASLPPALRALVASAQSSNMAAAWRRLADRAASQGYFTEAAHAYSREAAIYRRTGDRNAAQVEELKSAQYATSLDLYVDRVAMPWDYAHNDTHARLEPPLGCYVGAFIDRDDNLPQLSLGGQTFGDVGAFARRVGKPHASHFMYRRYGQPFPAEWARYLKRHHVIPHIAWEPESLDAVRDDPYLRSWVETARALDWPVFIRFAGEMNGDWTRYHGNPAAYRAAFRRVYRAFRAAPRVALIWCPNTVPENGLDDYYPGDDACDWVGVNFYSVLYLDNDVRRRGDRIHPTDLLDYVYRRYSARKPIAIAEYAATHEAQADRIPRPEFAVDKIAQLYTALPTRYPRVKMVDWYDCNNLRHAAPGRQLNNYLLTDFPEILSAYASAVAGPWFLGADSVARGDDAHEVLAPLHDGDQVRGASALTAWVRTYVNRPQVFFRLDGRLVHATRSPERCFISTAGLGRGRHALEVLVYDDRGRFIASSKKRFELL